MSGKKTIDIRKGNTKRMFPFFFIAITTFICYFPSFQNTFTNWDDNSYILNNEYIRSFSIDNIFQVFSNYFLGNYHPLTLISFLVDYLIAGLKPAMYIFTNLMLHITNSLLLFVILKKLIKSGNLAFFVALLFGVHTLHVESVTWISERKDVLYTFFYFLAWYTYIRYITEHKIRLYFLSLFLFVLSLFSKGQAVSFALLLPITDWFLTRNLKSPKILLEKIPFLILSLTFGILAINAQQASSATENFEHFSFIETSSYASYAFIMYIVKILFPLNLSAYYPYPTHFSYSYFIFIPIAVLTTIFLIFKLRKSPLLLFGFLFFILHIIFLLQLIPVGDAIMADRYTYISSIGIFIIIGAISDKLYQAFKSKQTIFIILGIYFFSLFIMTFNRVKIWNNSETLWSDTIEKEPESYLAWYNRGTFYFAQNNFNKAVADFNKAIEINPGRAKFWNDRGMAYSKLKMFSQSLNDFNRGLELEPNNTKALNNRGMVKIQLNDLNGAISDFKKAIEMEPEYVQPYINYSTILYNKNEFEGSLKILEKASQFKANNSDILYNKGNSLIKLSDFKQAIESYQKAIQINPAFAEAYYNLSIAYHYTGDDQNASICQQKANQLFNNRKR